MTHKKTFVLLSYDWRNLFKTDPQAVREKLLRDHLDPDKHRFFFVSWSTEAYRMDLEENISTVHMRARFRSVRPLYDFLLSLKIKKILTTQHVKPDAIIVYDFGMVYAAKKYAQTYDIPIILFVTNLPDTLLRTRKQSLVRHLYQQMLERRCTSSLAHVFVISEATEKYAKKLGVPQENIHRFAPDTITPYIEALNRVQKGAIRQRYAIAPDKHILLSVGRLEPEKGFDRLLDAFAQIKHDDLMLVIVGDGILRDDLKMQAKTLGVERSVLFVGDIPHEELWAYYADCDMFVLFSRSEALGLVVWEAMCTGVPVIVSGTEGLLESAGRKAERGLVWNANDGYDVLRKNIDRILRHDPEIQAMTVRARSYVQDKLQASKTIDNVI